MKPGAESPEGIGDRVSRTLGEVAGIRRSPVTITTILGGALLLSGIVAETSHSNDRLLLGMCLLFIGQGWLQAQNFRIVHRHGPPSYRWGNGVLALLLLGAAFYAGCLYFARRVTAWVTAVS